ncbi:MAG: hypothetical protein ABIR57_03720 [Aeromicrobium sp.]
MRGQLTIKLASKLGAALSTITISAAHAREIRDIVREHTQVALPSYGEQRSHVNEKNSWTEH